MGGSEATARRNSDDVRFMRETLHKLTQLVSDLLPRKGSLCLFGCFAMHSSGSCYYCLPVDRFLGDLAPVSRAFPSQSRALVLSPPRYLPRSPFSRTGLRSHHCRVQARFPTKTLRRIHKDVRELLQELGLIRQLFSATESCIHAALDRRSLTARHRRRCLLSFDIVAAPESGALMTPHLNNSESKRTHP